jgi:hypothetical protein
VKRHIGATHLIFCTDNQKWTSDLFSRENSGCLIIIAEPSL